jgi:hypothetical protein
VHGDAGPRQVGLNAALTFDASVRQLLTLLDAVRRDDRLLVAYAREAGLDVLNCTPTQAETLVAAGLLDGPAR